MRFSVTQDRISQALNYSGQVTQDDLSKWLRPEDQSMLDQFSAQGMTASSQLYMLYILFLRMETEQSQGGPRMQCVHAQPLPRGLPQPAPIESVAPEKGQMESGRRLRIRKR